MERIILLSKLYDAGRAMLEGKAELVEAYCDNPREVEALFEGAAGILLGNQKFGADIIARHPNLKFLAKQGSGFDNIDTAAATRAGMPVVISAGANAQAVAEHVMLLTLAANRCLYRYETAIRKGNFAVRSSCASRELQGKTLGLVGLGRIGRAVEKYARAFGMKTLAYDPWISPENAKETDCCLCESLEELLERSDTVSIHVPLTPETRGMLNARTILRMKPGSVLINCSRGGIVDEDALYRALTSGHLCAAGLDVFEREPASADHPLFTLDNVIATPHCAALTWESAQAMSSKTAEGILAVLEGKCWDGVANPEVYETQVG